MLETIQYYWAALSDLCADGHWPLWAWCVFAPAGIITFVSYQSIPSNLEKMNSDQQSHIVGSEAFTAFVRWCGLDHAIMVIAMFPIWPDHLIALPLASAWAVAVISSVSAFIIAREAR